MYSIKWGKYSYIEYVLFEYLPKFFKLMILNKVFF